MSTDMSATQPAEAGLAIRTRGLTKSYGRHRGLVDLDLEVRRGEVFGFIGPNGAGKTTAIRLLLDLLRPTSGSVEVLGEPPRRGGPVLRRRIGYLPGDLVLPPRLTGGRVVDLLLSLSGPASASGHAARRTRLGELAERLDLDLTRPMRTLSKGNRQKVGIVQALVHDPDLLVLDEPTSGLDPLVQQTFHALVREAAARGGTVFMSSHVISEVEQTADRVGVLREGRLVAVATVDELRTRSGRHVEVEVRQSGGVGVAEIGAALSLRDVTGEPAAPGSVRVGGSHDGEAADLVAGLASATWARDVTDVVVGRRDLEDAVLGYYGDRATPPTGGDAPAGPAPAAAPTTPTTPTTPTEVSA